NARSTVGSITEINDYLRLLFGAIGHTVCPQCGGEVARDTVAGACERIVAAPAPYLFVAPYSIGTRPLAQAVSYLSANGYHRMFVNGAMADVQSAAEICAAGGSLPVVIDRVLVEGEQTAGRVREALEKAFYLGADQARVIRLERQDGQ